MKKVILFIVISFMTLPIYGQRIGFSSNSIIRFTDPNGVSVNYNHYLSNNIDLNIHLAFLWESSGLQDQTKRKTYFIPLTVGTRFYFVNGSFKPYLNLEVGLIYTNYSQELYEYNFNNDGRPAVIYNGSTNETRLDPASAISVGTMIELSNKFSLDIDYKQFSSIGRNSRAHFGLIDIGVLYQL